MKRNIVLSTMLSLNHPHVAKTMRSVVGAGLGMWLAFATCLGAVADPSQSRGAVDRAGPCNGRFPSSSDPIDQIVAAIARNAHVPGMSIAIVRSGRLSRISSYGWSNLELCVPASDDTIFGIGSISKQFTAVGVMVLADSGKLSLDDPIVKYLPEGSHRWQGITIRHLLTHTSGIKDYVGDDDKYDSIHPDRSSNISATQLVSLFAQPPLNFKAGADWAYSNTGYLLLSIIIERVSGESFQQFMHEKVFAPLDMTSTRYYSPRELVSNRASPYHIGDDGEVTNGQYISDQFSHWGDMGMLSTAGDMAKWAIAMMTESVFPASTWKSMKKPVNLNDGSMFPYGFGLQLDEIAGTPIVHHNGSFRAGYSADLVTFPTRGLAVVAISNYWGANGGIPPVAVTHAIVASIDPSLVRSDRAAVADPQPNLTVKLLNILRAKDRIPALGVTRAFAHLPIPPGLPVKSLKYVGCDAVAAIRRPHWDPAWSASAHTTSMRAAVVLLA